jgi:hypothetical protein
MNRLRERFGAPAVSATELKNAGGFVQYEKATVSARHRPLLNDTSITYVDNSASPLAQSSR